MALPQHHRRLLLAVVVASALVRFIDARSSPISDLKSKISGVEELLEEFRQQLQQEQAHKLGDAIDSCAGDFSGVRDSIIQTRASIEQGATFLLAPDRAYTWKDCVHACCSQPHCTVAVVQEERGRPGEPLNCYLFNCTYRNKHVCSFAPQPGFGTYSRAANTSQGHLPASAGGSAWVSAEDETQGGSFSSPASIHVVDAGVIVRDAGVSVGLWWKINVLLVCMFCCCRMTTYQEKVF